MKASTKRQLIGALIVLGIIGFLLITAYRSQLYYMHRIEDYRDAEQHISDALSVFLNDNSRYPTNLMELYPDYYAPSNRTHLTIDIISEAATYYSHSSNTYTLVMPFGDNNLSGDFSSQHSSEIEIALSTKVVFIARQALLRDLVNYLNDQVDVNISIDHKLNQIADLAIDHSPEEDSLSEITISDALDVIVDVTKKFHNISIAWKSDADSILVYYDGTDEQYERLPKVDK